MFCNYSLLASDGSHKYLTASERKRFIAAAEKSEHKVYIFFLLQTGTRVSESLSVAPCHFHDEGPGRRSVIVRTLKQRRKMYREIPITDYLWEMIVKEFPRRKWGHRNSRVRLWQHGRKWGWRTIKKVMKEAGINSAASCPKGMRHTFATHAINNDVPIGVIREVMGHSSVQMTMHYAHISKAKVRRSLEEAL